MAQYYNLVTGTSVPIMVEDVQQLCDGQSIQLVVEDLNNCTNGGQRFLTYAQSPQCHDAGLFSQRTILGSRLTGVPIDQRQNVYIINATNDLQQSGLKADVVHATLANDSIVIDQRGTKLPLNNIHEVQQEHEQGQEQQQQQQQQQQIQWISMPENDIKYEETTKLGVNPVKVASTGTTQPQRPEPTDQRLGGSVSQYTSLGPSEKKMTPRLYRNKGRGGATGGGSGGGGGGGPARQSSVNVDSGTTINESSQQRQNKNLTKSQLTPLTQTGANPISSSDTTSLEPARQNSNLTNNRTASNSTGNNPGGAYRGKTFGTPMPNVIPPQNIDSRQTPTKAAILSKNSDNIGNARNTTSVVSKATKSPSVPHYPAMDSLSERIKQAKLQKLMAITATGQTVNVPASPSPRAPIHGTLRQQTTATTQTTTALAAAAATTASSVLNRGSSQTGTNDKPSTTGSPGTDQQQQQRRRQSTSKQQSSSQDNRRTIEIVKKHTSITCQQKYQREAAQTTTSPSSVTSISDSDDRMEVESPSSECALESDSTNNHDQEESANEEKDGSSESFAYLQEVIENPQTTIVQNQITSNTVKMLVVMQNGEQSLITFDIPIEPCTVHDLLEQANISFGEETCVSLVADRILGINYIVEGGAHTSVASLKSSGSPEGGQTQENTGTKADGSSPNFAAPDENSDSSVTPNEVGSKPEEPKFVDGKLAVCPNCGISSPDFHRCSRCKRILPDNVKSIPMTPDTQAKKETMISIDSFYKKAHEHGASLKTDSGQRVDASRLKKQIGRGGRRPVAKTRLIKEPECLTISSDEEDGGEKPKKSDSNVSSVSSSTYCGSSANEDSDTILEKEPVITNSSSSMSTDGTVESEGGTKGGGREEEVVEGGAVLKPYTSLLCRTVRIGSYKYVPREKIVVSKSGLRLAVPLFEDEKSFVYLDIKYRDILKVLIHFGKTMPVLFFYTSPHSAAMIREVLGMQDAKGPYYDPAGKDHTHKRITLLPESLSTESRVILKGLFTPGDLLVELNPKEANDILVRASPKDVLQNLHSALGGFAKRSSQSASGGGNPSVNGGSAQTYQIMTVYPPPPAKGGIAINTEDYVCLGEDQFLNDAIIDFYLRYLTLEILSETDHNRTHVFSSYFYKRLTSPNAQAGESSGVLTAAARRHARVQKWTKNVNIFDKDFIIIPINEHAHWFLAIICYPGLVGKVIAAPQTPQQDGGSQKSGGKEKKNKDVKPQALTIGSTTITPLATTITIDQMDEGSERDEAEGDDEEMEMESDEEEETENRGDESAGSPVRGEMSPASPEVVRRDPVKTPCILIFDSLAGAGRSRVVATLRDYLSCEHVAKVGTEKVFSKDTIKGSSPKVPQQSNFTDCGLYLLQYVESFFQSPITDYSLPIKSLKNWFEEIVVTRKREELAKLLVRLMNRTRGDKEISLPVVQFPTHNGKLRPKPETTSETKASRSEAECKKKPAQNPSGAQQQCVDDKTRLVAVSTSSVLTTTENAGEKPELVTRTTTVYQIIPCSPSPLNSSSGESSQETLFDAKPKTSSGTLSYLRNKRIPRLMTRENEGQENQPTPAKKHKGGTGEILAKGSSGTLQIPTNPKPVVSTDVNSS